MFPWNAHRKRPRPGWRARVVSMDTSSESASCVYKGSRSVASDAAQSDERPVHSTRLAPWNNCSVRVRVRVGVGVGFRVGVGVGVGVGVRVRVRVRCRRGTL